MISCSPPYCSSPSLTSASSHRTLCFLRSNCSKIVQCEHVPKTLEIRDPPASDVNRGASTRDRGIVTVETVRSKLATAFSLANSATALFLGDQQLSVLLFLLMYRFPPTALSCV
jgi:hypothetical protein